MDSRFRVLADKDAAARAAGDDLLSCLRSALELRDVASCALSGGSTPTLIFRHLAAQDFAWDRVHFFWVDERCVGPDDADSNYGAAKAVLLDPLGVGTKQVHRIEGEREPVDEADRYASEVRESFGLQAGAMPPFDVLHLGMGADAHTASLFPQEPLIENREGITTSVYAALRSSYRVTLLPGAILSARWIFFLVTGDDKRSTLKSVVEGKYDPSIRPVQLFDREGKDVAWFLDRAAAQDLT